MPSLRKYPKMVPGPRKSWFTIDRGLLAGVAALVGIGGFQMSAVNVADNKLGPKGGAPVMTAARPSADYTPVGSIDSAKNAALKLEADKKLKDEQRLQAPFGLRSAR